LIRTFALAQDRLRVAWVLVVAGLVAQAYHAAFPNGENIERCLTKA
jgi:hypothetical protein